MKTDRRRFITSSMLAVGSLAAPVSARAQDGAETGQNADRVSIRGRVVCLTEELDKIYQVTPDCDNRGHIYSIKTNDGRIYPLLPTDMALAVWLDERYRQRDLQVTGRAFPNTNYLEVIKYQSWVDEKLYDLYYFCDVCMINTHKPGPCDCCKKPVEFRETPADNSPPQS